MRYEIRVESDGTPLLYRYGMVALSNDGRPDNAQLEFWFEIELLRGLLEKANKVESGRIQQLREKAESLEKQANQRYIPFLFGAKQLRTIADAWDKNMTIGQWEQEIFDKEVVGEDVY